MILRWGGLWVVWCTMWCGGPLLFWLVGWLVGSPKSSSLIDYWFVFGKTGMRRAAMTQPCLSLCSSQVSHDHMCGLGAHLTRCCFGWLIGRFGLVQCVGGDADDVAWLCAAHSNAPCAARERVLRLVSHVISPTHAHCVPCAAIPLPSFPELDSLSTLPQYLVAVGTPTPSHRAFLHLISCAGMNGI